MSGASRQATLAETGLETLRLFKNVRKIDNIVRKTFKEEWPSVLFAAEADRFELWAVNLGLFVSGHGSLDYRIREAESLERTLRRFMKDLNDSLIEVVEYCTGETDQSENEAHDDSTRRPFDQFLEEELEEDSGQEADSDIDLLLDSIRDPIDRLYKLSTRIRSPSSRLGSSKALRHQQLDPETGIDLLCAIEAFDYDHVSSLILQYRKSKALQEHQIRKPAEEDRNDDANHVWEPLCTVLSQYHDELLNGTESFIVRRIARGNVRRRQQFAYWKQHRDKLSRHTRSFTQHLEVGEETTPALVNVETVNQFTLPTVAPVQSVTTASRLNISQLVDTDNRSTVSVSEYAPSMWRPGKEVVDFPPPPKRGRDEKFFECSYCFTLCSAELLTEKAWKAHLIHDLRPYICTYEDCRNPEQLYDSRHDWIRHENSMHRRIWRCPEHAARAYTSLEEYRKHLRNEHADFADEALESQLIHSAETSLASADRCCPICSQVLETAKSLHTHIALHLERFAMFALPRSVDDSNDSAVDGDSDKVNTAFEGSREDDFDSDEHVEGENDIATSAAGIAQQRWKRVLNRVVDDLRLKRGPSFQQTLHKLWPETSRDQKRSIRFDDQTENAFALAKALKGDKNAPDSATLIEILPRLTHDQVLDLRVEYKRLVKTGSEKKGVNIAKHIKLRLKDEDSSLMKACYACALGQWESEAYWANFWYQSEKSRRELLIESLLGRTNHEIRMIKDGFSDKKYDNSLTKCLRAELKEDRFKKMILLTLEERRMEEGQVDLDLDLVENDVRDLHEAVGSEQGSETEMSRIVVLRSDSHLREVLRIYEATHRTNFAREMLKKSANLMGESMAHILNGVINKPVRDALLIHHGLERLKEDDSSSVELLISRLVRYHWNSSHMEAVKREYKARYGMEMQKAVADGTKGDWGHFCERLCVKREIELPVRGEVRSDAVSDVIKTRV